VIIYKIQNRINGKVYVGKTIHSSDIRFEQHIKSSRSSKNDSVLCRALRKYGIQSFDISVIDETEDKNILNEKEKYWIKFYDSKNNGYNMTDGGDGGNLSKYRSYRPWSDEEKERISLKTKEAMANLSSKQREKLRGNKGKIGEKNPNYGRKASEEQKRKNSESHKGLPSGNKGKKYPYKARSPRPDMMGENNPAKRPEVRKKLSENNPMKNPELRAKCKGNLGKRYPYKERPKAKGRVIWNKGLTKETDERVRKISETEKNTKAKVRL
jgi:group I intron endonuclease